MQNHQNSIVHEFPMNHLKIQSLPFHTISHQIEKSCERRGLRSIWSRRGLLLPLPKSGCTFDSHCFGLHKFLCAMRLMLPLIFHLFGLFRWWFCGSNLWRLFKWAEMLFFFEVKFSILQIANEPTSRAWHSRKPFQAANRSHSKTSADIPRNHYI